MQAENIVKQTFETNNIYGEIRPSHYLPIITLNVNGLNSSVERYRLTVWIKKKIYTLAITNTLHQNTHTHRMKVKGWEKIPCK